MIEQNNSFYDLIVAIVNKGYTDLVMEAAKENGARGGTTFVARGTGNKELGSFFGIAIQPEKEIVFILVSEEIKEKVLLGIYKAAGLDTKGSGIAFSIKVDDCVGLTPFSDVEIEEEQKDEAEKERGKED